MPTVLELPLLSHGLPRVSEVFTRRGENTHTHDDVAAVKALGVPISRKGAHITADMAYVCGYVYEVIVNT